MPIEYVLIEVPAAFPKDHQYTFPGGNGDPFPIANREELGEIQVRSMSVNGEDLHRVLWAHLVMSSQMCRFLSELKKISNVMVQCR